MSATRVIGLLTALAGVSLTAACYVAVDDSLAYLSTVGVLSEAPPTNQVLDCVLTSLKSCQDALAASPLRFGQTYDPGFAWIGLISAFLGLCAAIIGPIRMSPGFGPGPLP
jgi:hypothetical protein